MQPQLYLVYLEEPSAEAPDTTDLRQLRPGLYLVESGQTRSRLYHDVKRRFQPGRLLVAPLAEAPKFKGRAAGVQKWLRVQGHA